MKYSVNNFKIYNNVVKQERISHFARLITDHKNNPKILFSTIDLSINADFNKSSRVPTDALCEDFADHFRSKIDVFRSSLLLQQNVVFNTSELLLLLEEALESFVLVDGKMFDGVFSQVNNLPFRSDSHIIFKNILCIL